MVIIRLNLNLPLKSQIELILTLVSKNETLVIHAYHNANDTIRITSAMIKALMLKFSIEKCYSVDNSGSRLSDTPMYSRAELLADYSDKSQVLPGASSFINRSISVFILAWAVSAWLGSTVIGFEIGSAAWLSGCLIAGVMIAVPAIHRRISSSQISSVLENIDVSNETYHIDELINSIERRNTQSNNARLVQIQRHVNGERGAIAPGSTSTSSSMFPATVFANTVTWSAVESPVECHADVTNSNPANKIS